MGKTRGQLEAFGSTYAHSVMKKPRLKCHEPKKSLAFRRSTLSCCAKSTREQKLLFSVVSSNSTKVGPHSRYASKTLKNSDGRVVGGGCEVCP